MKNTLYRTKIGLAFVTASLLTMVSCTGDFEHFNTDPNSAQQIDPTTLITSMELDAMYPTTGETTVPVNNYQTGWNLLADHYEMCIRDSLKGKSYRDIAVEYAISERRVETELARALDKLRRRLKDYLPVILVSLVLSRFIR